MDYNSVRALTDASSAISRVEVNQRALIDKILARYATASAVYRELLQNSNDASAKVAEVEFTTENHIVQQVTYRNNGFPFRPQDWDRLQKIAEGNPNEDKIGAFGVGAYSMFSITEEPVVVSGDRCLLFCWQGDALYTKTATNQKVTQWTTFVLPSRDPYPLPDLAEFGEFLAAALTFTNSLKNIRVLVDGMERLSIIKTTIQPPQPIQTPVSSASKLSSFLSLGSSSSFQSSSGMFSLAKDTIQESVVRLTVVMDQTQTAVMDARYVLARIPTRIPSHQHRRMHRVTKKDPPKHVNVQLFLNYNSTKAEGDRKSTAFKIAQSFAPVQGKGKIFIGFRTSQTTGLAAHVAAPFLPTVEREAMDLQDPALAKFNIELLEMAGILMRITLEHSMRVIDATWQNGKAEREALDAKLIAEVYKGGHNHNGTPAVEEKEEESSEETGGMMSFARFMARGVTKTIVAAAKTIIDSDGSEMLLNPPDPRPLSSEEEQAVVLMSSFCPQPSTPDTKVGTVLAQGFSNCFPNSSPPVLTKSGVLPGDFARLRNHGIEGFVSGNVVRSIVQENAEEYHSFVARCRKLTVDDLVGVVSKTTFDMETTARLLRWWRRFCKATGANPARGNILKDSIRFRLNGKPDTVHQMQSYLFFVEEKYAPLLKDLPLPETVLPTPLHEAVGASVLTSDVFRDIWFSSLPFEIFTEFISHHQCMTDGKPEDDMLRLKILTVLCQEYQRRYGPERTVYGNLCQTLFSKKKCIPFDSDAPTAITADCPGEVYLSSAELRAFDGIGSFHKASAVLQGSGVSDDFLLALGVRKSVSVDFLFAHLDTLAWSKDPKTLIEYLRTATLTRTDVQKLQSSKYLPAKGDSQRSFAPSELYLPNEALDIFPFARQLQWPSEPEVSERSENGRFLVRLGVQSHPGLTDLLAFISNSSLSDDTRIKALDYISDELGSHHGIYAKEYKSLGHSVRNSLKFLPCSMQEPLSLEAPKRIVCSVRECCGESSAAVMGFPVIDPKLGKRGEHYSDRFGCDGKPPGSAVLSKLAHITVLAKSELKKCPSEKVSDANRRICKIFNGIFGYLSRRVADFNAAAIETVARDAIIPFEFEGKMLWLLPEEVFFRRSDKSVDSLTEELFHMIDFNPFLAAAGVKESATTKEIMQRILKSPDDVLRIMGCEAKYRSLLRRIAASPPFSLTNVPENIRKCSFLLGYSVRPNALQIENDDSDEVNEKITYKLAKAEDIYVVDNANFARMFPVQRAPPETDLEDFYIALGSKYISKSITRRYEIVGKPTADTELVNAFRERLRERGPLLVSPNVTSRPLVRGAAKILEDSKLDVYEATNLLVVYTLGTQSRRNRTTCFARPDGKTRNLIFLTEDFDMFDAGQAIGDLILQRCQLEDAFFISSLLEAPLDSLRSRGFPVDRLVKPAEPTFIPVADENTDISEQSSKNAVDQESATRSLNDDSEGSKVDILKNMFPDADKGMLKSLLGKDPTMNDVMDLANQLASGVVPKADDNTTVSTKADGLEQGSSPTTAELSKKKSLRKRLSKAFGGKKASSFGGMQMPQSAGATVSSSTNSTTEQSQPVPPASDVNTQSILENSLANSVSSANTVQKSGFDSPETNLTSIPKDLDRGDSCEVLPGHSLKPFSGPLNTGKTKNGIVVFSSSKFAQSEAFLAENESSLGLFADLLESLCIGVFGLKLNSIAIYHDPAGVSIAFNRNRALHFNLRFFHALHYLQNKAQSNECYSYWFVIICHELAHNFVSAHNKEHGFYTESFAQKYMPKLASLLDQLEAGRRK